MRRRCEVPNGRVGHAAGGIDVQEDLAQALPGCEHDQAVGLAWIGERAVVVTAHVVLRPPRLATISAVERRVVAGLDAHAAGLPVDRQDRRVDDAEREQILALGPRPRPVGGRVRPAVADDVQPPGLRRRTPPEVPAGGHAVRIDVDRLDVDALPVGLRVGLTDGDMGRAAV